MVKPINSDHNSKEQRTRSDQMMHFASCDTHTYTYMYIHLYEEISWDWKGDLMRVLLSFGSLHVNIDS